MKSAYELAMEKASKLGSASTEERKAAQEKELAPIGLNLAERYLRGSYPLRDVGITLERQVTGRDIVVAAIKSRLVDALAAGDYHRPLEGLVFLAQDKARVEAAAKRVEALCREHQETKRQRLEEAAEAIEQAKRRELEALGISGSAIRIAAGATEEWQRLVEEIDASFRQALEPLRADLIG